MYIHEEVKNTVIKSYEFKSVIGEGVSSKVYKAYDNKRKCNFAIKVIPKLYLTSHPKLYQLVKNQISILKACDNPNVVKCYDVFQSTNSIFIVTELCNSLDLESYLAKRKRLAEDHAVIFLKQLLNGFKGLHSLGCMHRDFKSANILIKNQNCKIADLGFAKKMNQSQITYTMVGTHITMAPQVLEEKGYGYEADIWSLGVVFYQMIFGKYPFMGVNKLDLLNKIKNVNVNFQKVKISSEAKDFIERCLTYDPSKRLAWHEIYNHQIINKKQFEMLYSIVNFSGSLQKNIEFYTKQNLQSIKATFQKEIEFETPQQQSQLLRETSRKMLIIEQIREIIRKKQSNQKKQEQEAEDDSLLFQKYVQEYVYYFNKLSCVFKFVRIVSIKDILQKINGFLQNRQFTVVNLGGHVKLVQKKIKEQNISVQQIIYLLYKKAYCELLQFSKILQSQYNVFKIPKKWNEFSNSELYKKMSEVIHNEINKCKSLLLYFQQSASLSNIQQISVNACQQSYDYQKVLSICAKWLKVGIKSLLQYLKLEQNDDKQFMDFMQGILYIIIGEDASKMRPQDFDLRMEQPNTKSNKKDLIQRFDIYFDYMI